MASHSNISAELSIPHPVLNVDELLQLSLRRHDLPARRENCTQASKQLDPSEPGESVIANGSSPCQRFLPRSERVVGNPEALSEGNTKTVLCFTRSLSFRP